MRAYDTSCVFELVELLTNSRYDRAITTMDDLRRMWSVNLFEKKPTPNPCMICGEREKRAELTI